MATPFKISHIIFPNIQQKIAPGKKNKKKTANNKNLTQAGQILATSHVFSPQMVA